MGEEKGNRLLFIGLMTGLLLSALDQTIVSTAMPSIIGDLHGMKIFSWVFTVYMLASTTLVPIFGKMSDIYGRKRSYVLGIVVFMVGSLLCGIAHTMFQLILFRTIQGIGAGAIMPITLTMLSEALPPERRGKIQGIFAIVFGISSIFGPIAGVAIVKYISWGWIFFINLPIGLVALILVIKNYRSTIKWRIQKIDYAGALVLTIGITTMLLGFNIINGTSNSKVLECLCMLALGVLFLGCFFWIERKVTNPILAPALFKNRNVVLFSVISFVGGVTFYLSILFIPLFVQGVIGGPSNVGIVLLPLMISFVIGNVTGGQLLAKMSYRNILFPSFLLICMAFVCLIFINKNTSLFAMGLFSIPLGLGLGIILPLTTVGIQFSVEFKYFGIATSLPTFFRNVGGAIAVNLAGANLNYMFLKQGNFQIDNAQALMSEQFRSMLPRTLLKQLQIILTNGISHIFLFGVIIGLVGLLSTYLLYNLRFELPQLTKKSLPRRSNA